MIDYKLLFLGTAASAFSKKRNPTSMVLIVEGRGILLDCGPGATRRLVENDVDLTTIDTVFISHGHNDHLIGITTFLWQNWLAHRRKNPLEIIAPGYVISRIDELLKLTNTPAGIPEFELNKINIDDHEDSPDVQKIARNFHLDHDKCGDKSAIQVTWTTARGKHDPDSYAIRVNLHEGGKQLVSFCYSADTSPQARVSRLAKDVTYLIHEATFLEEKRELANTYNHSTPMGAAKIATAANAKNLILVHYSNTIEGKEEEMEKEARDFFEGNVIIANDGLEIRSPGN